MILIMLIIFLIYQINYLFSQDIDDSNYIDVPVIVDMDITVSEDDDDMYFEDTNFYLDDEDVE